MIVVHTQRGSQMAQHEDVSALQRSEEERVVWIDLVAPDEREVQAAEAFIGTELMSPKDAAEIESSSRYYEDPPTEIQLNAFFLQPADKGLRPEPVTFALRNDVLVTRRNAPLRSFVELARRRKSNPAALWSAYDTFISLFDLRIDYDADLVEQIGRDIAQVNKDVNLNTVVNKALLLKIDEMLDEAMLLRANIVDKQRTLSAVMKSEGFPASHRTGIRTLLRDIDSLLEHIAFGFERLEFLQNTAMGLVNIDQNKVIKIFTIATVAFMPPMLIASIYGMNFRRMPELVQPWGYPMAVALMLLSSGGTMLYFKRKGWL